MTLKYLCFWRVKQDHMVYNLLARNMSVVKNNNMPDDTMDIDTALRKILEISLMHNGVRHGFRTSTKLLNKKQALLCILPDDCSNELYKMIIQDLCDKHKIPLMKIHCMDKLGEWIGLCKIDSERKPYDIKNCYCVVITNFGENTPANDIVMDHIRQSAIPKPFNKI